MSYKRFFYFILFGAPVFWIDLITPTGTGIWAVYVLLLMLYTRRGSFRIYHLSAVYATLIVIGYFMSPAGTMVWIAEINRLASLVMLYFVAYLARRERRVKTFNAEILDRVSDAIIALDTKWNITYLSSSIIKISGLESDPIGKKIWEVFPKVKGTDYEKYSKQAIATQKQVSFRSNSFLSDVKYQVYAYPSCEGLTVIAKNVTEIIEKEEELNKLLHQKEILIKETHHRVKNNFQLISSLLRLSVSDIQDEQTTRIFFEVESRIKTLALIHERLYKSANGENVDLKTFLDELLNQLTLAANHTLMNIQYEIVVDHVVDIELNNAISIGLIVNELYSNSLKHGFKGRSSGIVSLKLCLFKGDKSTVQMIYKDNGIGFEKDPALNTASLGMAIVNSYVQQSHGTIKVISNGHGVEYDIILRII